MEKRHYTWRVQVMYIGFNIIYLVLFVLSNWSKTDCDSNISFQLIWGSHKYDDLLKANWEDSKKFLPDPPTATSYSQTDWGRAGEIAVQNRTELTWDMRPCWRLRFCLQVARWPVTVQPQPVCLPRGGVSEPLVGKNANCFSSGCLLVLLLHLLRLRAQSYAP